jgi:predicted DNA-binding transcriptional regulator AlpA
MINAKLVRESSRARILPRGLSRLEAAGYVGVSGSTFDQMVKDGRMPAPKRVNARTIWDMWQLDDAFEALPSDGDQERDPFETVSI